LRRSALLHAVCNRQRALIERSAVDGGKSASAGVEKREEDIVIRRVTVEIEIPRNQAGSVRKCRDGHVADRTVVHGVRNGSVSAVDDEGSADPRRVVVAANNDAVVRDRGVGIGDEESAIWRRGNCGMDRNFRGWINADDTVQEPARKRRTDRISARVEEMR
jgi:hypothetical protein